jgi:hypothetical protein
VTLTEADSGSTVCLAVGMRLEVYLHGSPSAKWSPIAVTGTGVAVAPSGKGALALGVTGGFYAATAAGDAQLASTRPDCGTPSPGASCATRTFVVQVHIN